MDTKKEIALYLEKEINALKKINIDEWNAVLNCILKHYEHGDTIYTMGNGGSASTASHMTCDFNKGASYDLNKKFNFVCLSENIAELTATANDTGYENIFYYPLLNKIKKDDLVIAFSGSGNSVNIIKACEYAKQVGCDVIGVTGYSGGKLKQIANYHIDVNIDDMQISEDVHLIFNHLMVQIITKILKKEN